MNFHRLIAAALLLASLFATPHTARAAESFDNCTGFIDTLPMTVSTQGVWCLRKDLSTNITSGAAITVANNNITIDCNDFKLGGLAAGDGSLATGILADGRQNATVRHCIVRGFYYGVWFNNGAGHLVEDNRFDNNLYIGIYATGVHNLVQHNRLFDTGGATGGSTAWGIDANADVVDNIVDGVFAAATDTAPRGIHVSGDGSVVSGNRVRGLVVAGGGNAIGIDVANADVTVDGNRVVAGTAVAGTGISGNTNVACGSNVVINFATSYSGCAASTADTSLP